MNPFLGEVNNRTVETFAQDAARWDEYLGQEHKIEKWVFMDSHITISVNIEEKSYEL